uniref:Uncharacterized protein n=1 Tax=Rhizophora mucronata TaxID=61149 RepID=A0A2P2J3T3_RHIMU
MRAFTTETLFNFIFSLFM